MIRTCALLLLVPLLGVISASSATASLRAESEVVRAIPIDPWLTLGAQSLTALEISLEGISPAKLEITLAGRAPILLEVPADAGPRWVVTARDLSLSPFELPASGVIATWRLLPQSGEPIASGSVTLEVRNAEASLAALERAIEEAPHPLAKAAALEDAALFALDLGLSSRADRHVLALRALAPSLAGHDAAATRRSSIVGAILSARIQRTYADADPVHRRASLDRIERLQKAVEDDPELSAQCAILLAEAALERMLTSRGAERRKLLDRARELARSAREGERGLSTAVDAELLWVRVAIARGWRTESVETLDKITSQDPRIVARVAYQRAQVERTAGEPPLGGELARAVSAAESIRRHAGSLAIDAGLTRIYLEPYRAWIGHVAATGDGLETWAAIEALRPREPGTRAPDGAELSAMIEQWGADVTLLACADVAHAIVTVRANSAGIVVEQSLTELGATRERVRALLRARGSDPTAVDWLSERILAPHEGKLTPQVVLAPLGTLRPLPFDLLEVGNRVLGEAHVTWSVPGARAVRRAPALMATAGPVIAFVDPIADYDGDGTSDHDRLPSTRDEVAPWRDVAGGFARYQGALASEARLRREVGLARVLHLGCHGEHARHRPWYSELLLAPGEGQDGRLSATELAELDLSGCALVCLSGCETGLSRAEGGDDLAGFPRAVLQSGAGSFLGSLWPVDDGTAGVFFRNFHDQLRQSGNPRLALRQARRESRLDPERRAPRHWAAWVLLENFADPTDTSKRGD